MFFEAITAIRCQLKLLDRSVRDLVTGLQREQQIQVKHKILKVLEACQGHCEFTLTKPGIITILIIKLDESS